MNCFQEKIFMIIYKLRDFLIPKSPPGLRIIFNFFKNSLLNNFFLKSKIFIDIFLAKNLSVYDSKVEKVFRI